MVVIKGPWGDKICVLAAGKNNGLKACDLACIKFIFAQHLRLLQKKKCGLLQLTKMIWTNAYWMDIWLCVVSDIHECNRGLGECDLNVTCINTFGSYVCMCNTGFTGNGFICMGKKPQIIWGQVSPKHWGETLSVYTKKKLTLVIIIFTGVIRLKVASLASATAVTLVGHWAVLCSEVSGALTSPMACMLYVVLSALSSKDLWARASPLHHSVLAWNAHYSDNLMQ